MRIVLLVAGLKDSKATGLLRLCPYLEAQSWTVRVIGYGWFLLRGFLWQPFNKPLARMLACFVELLDSLGHQVVCVAHSNGATIAAEASRLGAPFKALVFIDGAVERDLQLGSHTGLLINCRIPSDPVLALSWIISPFTPWASLDGSLGNLGVKANSDARMWDINLADEFGISGHGGFMSAENVARTGPWLVKAIRWALGDSA